MMTKKISKGWDLTLFEKMKGWEKKLSINCPTVKPIKTYMALGRITVLKSESMKLVMVRMIIVTPPMIGPMYGMMLKSAQRNAITMAFSTPTTNNEIV